MKKLNLSKALYLLIIILFFQMIQPLILQSVEPVSNNAIYDICELYMDSKAIINYDGMFGDVIKESSFLVKDIKQPCVNYTYTYDKRGNLIQKSISHLYSGLEVIRFYKYNDIGLISEITEKRENFEKNISLSYNQNNKISEVREAMSSGAEDPLFLKFDFLKYKFDSKGNIIEVRGVKDKMLGLSSEILMLKAYDYDEKNRLRAIRDFMNPHNTQIFGQGDYVNK